MDVGDRKFLCSRIGDQKEDSIDGQSGSGPAVSLRRVEEDESGADRRYDDRGTRRQALARILHEPCRHADPESTAPRD